MPLPSKSSYRLDEIAERWNLCYEDLFIYALDGKLQLSALLLGQEIAFGSFVDEIEVETERRHVVGTLPLYAEDVARMAKLYAVSISRFKSDDPARYICPATSSGWMALSSDSVVVTVEERDRFERELWTAAGWRSKSHRCQLHSQRRLQCGHS